MAIPTTTYLDLWLIPDGSTPTPDWGALLNQNFQQIDAILGVPVTPGGTPGININADLPFNGNLIRSLYGATMVAQSAPLANTYINTLYDYNGQLWWNDSAGNATQVSGVSGVNSGFQGLPSGTAKAQFTFPAFSFFQSTNVYAPMQTGRLTIFDDTNPSPAHAVSLLSPAALAAAYNLTLPAALPGNSAMLIFNAAGSGAFILPDDASLYFSGTLQVKPLGIQTGMIALLAVTAAQIAANTITAGQIAAPLAQVGSVQTPTPLTNWGSGSPGPKYWIDVLGIVHLSGSVTITSTGGSLAVMTLAAGFFPTANRFFLVPTGGGVGNATIKIDASGNVSAQSLNNVSNGDAFALDAISFSTQV